MASLHRSSSWLLRAYAVLFSACAFVTALRAESPDSAYFPMHVGDERVSKVVFLSPLGKVENSTLMVTVKETVEREGKTYYRGRIVMDGAYARDYTKLMRKDDSGVYSIDESKPDQKEVADLLLPLKVGETQEVEVNGEKMKVAILGKESTAAGDKTYEDCYHIKLTPPSGTFEREMWLAPNVGAVKMVTSFVNGGKMSVMLEKYHAGGDDAAGGVK